MITTDHANHDNLPTLAAQNTGKAELLAVLAADLRVISDARLLLKTEKFVQNNTGLNTDETRRAILTERGRQNSIRRTNLQALCSDLLSKAPLYLNGSKLNDIGEGDPRNRFGKACQSLISFAFPSLRMLKGAYDETTLSKSLLDADDLLTGGVQPLSEAEQEVLTYVLRNQNSGERTSVEEIVRQFGKRPYGWYPMAVLTLIARLFRMGKIELRTTDLLDARPALEALKNTRQHGSIRVRLQEQFDPAKTAALKRFHQDFFDKVNEGSDPRSVALFTEEALTGEVGNLQVLLDQAGRYPFLKQLRIPAEKVKTVADKDYTYLLNHLTDFAGVLLDAKDDLLAPIKAFMHGPQRQTYDDVIAFYKEEAANFSEVAPAELDPLRELAASEAPFRGSLLPSAKAAVTKVRGLIDTMLDTERVAANATLDQREAQLRAIDDFGKLDAAAQGRVLAKVTEARVAIASARFVSAIRDRLARYATQDYPEQLALAARLAAPPPERPTTGNGPKTPKAPEPRYIPVGGVRVACNLPFIATETDLDQWLAELRKAIAAELAKGNRVSL